MSEDLNTDQQIEEEIKINWFLKLLLKLRPKLAIKILARRQGIDSCFEKIHEILAETKRIDIQPFSPANCGYRGFTIIIDQNTALYFYQEGDHFVYDGFEVGEYDKGEVTVFDQLK